MFATEVSVADRQTRVPMGDEPTNEIDRESAVSDGSDSLNAAWADYCDSLRTVGESVLASPHAHDDVSRAEGLRHLARMVALSLTQQIDFSDREDPRLFRSNDDVWQWGGPNVDNVYLGCSVDPRGTYRLRGDISGQVGSILQILGTPSPQDPVAVRVDVNLREVMNDSGLVDITLSGDASIEPDVVLPADGSRLVIREYIIDASAQRAGFIIERLDGEPKAESMSSVSLAGHLESSRRWIQHNMQFWQDYTAGRRDEIGVNRVGPMVRGPGMGSESIVYGTGFFDLDEDQCFVLELESPRARYWSVQLYSMGWYEPLDPTRRQTSLNHAQAHVDDDGRVRFVIAHADPGVPNWLDCAGHRRGMIHVRAVWCDEPPMLSGEVCDVADLAVRLPVGHPTTTDEQRRSALRDRRLLSQAKFVR